MSSGLRLDTGGMTAEQWWAELLSGTVGGVLSFVGIFVAFLLTRSHDRKKTAQSRMLAGVADILERTLKLRGIPYGRREEEILGSVSDALMLFYLREVTDHPRAAKWAQRQTQNLMKLLDSDADVRSARAYNSAIVGTLGAWIESERNDKVFKISGLDRSLETTWLPDDVDPGLTLARHELLIPTSAVREKIMKLDIPVEPGLFPVHEAADPS